MKVERGPAGQGVAAASGAHEVCRPGWQRIGS